MSIWIVWNNVYKNVKHTVFLCYFCVPLLPTCRFTGSGHWLVLCWLECPTSSSLLKAHLVRSWWRVWPVRILILWRQPAWRDRHCPQWHRTPREPSRTTNRKQTEDTAIKRTAVTKHTAILGLGPKTRSSRVLNSKIVFFFLVKYTEWLRWIIQNMSVYFQIIQCNWEIRRRCLSVNNRTSSENSWWLWLRDYNSDIKAP